MSRSLFAVVAIAISSHWMSGAECFAQQARALVGEPYGVAHVSVPLTPNADHAFRESRGFEISDPQGRVLYPAFGSGRLGQLAAEVLGQNPLANPNQLDVSFLFVGAEPFEITVYTPQPQRVTITPTLRRRGRLHQASLKGWWRAYHAQLREQESRGDYPPLVEAYLTEMLGQRLGLPSPLPSRRKEEGASELQRLIDRLFGSEDLRLATLRDSMRGRNAFAAPADIPVPEEFDWQPHEFRETNSAVAIESIAMHVPEECFYIRFGSFDNYLWMDHLKDDYGGDLGQMITLRGHDPKLDEKVQYQLALRQSAAKDFFGPQFISDVALIGRDLYLREGAALGMLFEAKDSATLTANLNQDRQEFLQAERDQGATLETVKFDGRDASFLSTPDNRLRSYYAVDGDYHLVTTSRSIVERFFQAGAGRGSLGTSAEFQHAREAMPLDRQDTIFTYFSTAFFGGLMSPQYQIVLSRRLQQATNDDLMQLAFLAAAGEGRPHANTADLVRGGFLPESFLHIDAAAAVDNASKTNGSARPAGFSSPIPDVALETITRSEAAQLERSAEFFRSQWQQMDPLMLSVKRTELPGERMERVVIEGNVSPLAEEKYGWLLSMIGPSPDVEIQSNPADVIKLQMSLQGGTRFPNMPPHQLFLGVQDVPVAGDDLIPSGRLPLLNVLKSTPGYLGAWPKIGLLDRLPLAPPPDAAGFSPLPAGLWRWQGNGFSVLSYYRDVLADASTHLQPVGTDNPAQIQLRIGDLSNSQLTSWVRSLSYSRAFQASAGNAKLLHTLSQQLRVPREQALTVANSLLDTELVCTLGGTYALHEEQGLTYWGSTAWPQNGQVPADYEAQLLTWFRGATADLTKTPDELLLHAEIDMQRKERDSPFGLPALKRFLPQPVEQE